MKVVAVEITDFLAIGSAYLRLDDQGLVLIQGENLDDTSQSSNGSGKSSIADAISWGLYGVTARGESGDSVIRKGAKKAEVKVFLLEGSDHYTVARIRKPKSVQLSVLNGLLDLTKGTSQLTQQVVNSIIGCSPEVFKAAVYSGQEQMPDLPGMTDKELKLLIEEAAGIQRLRSAYDEARNRKSHMADVASDIDRDLEEIKKEIETWQNEIDHYKEQVKLWDASRKVELKEMIDKVKKEKVEIDGIKAPDTSEQQKKLDEVKAKIANAKEYNDRLIQLKSKKVAASLEVIDLGRQLVRVERTLTIANDVSDITKCDACGREAGEHELAVIQQRRKDRVDSLLLDKLQAKQKLADANIALSDITREYNQCKDNAIDMSAEIELADSLSAAIKVAEVDAARLEARKKALKVAIESIKKAQLVENPHVAAVARSKAKQDKSSQTLKDVELEADVAYSELEIAGKVVEVFGQTGVRAHILDTVTPFLNQRTNEYLGTLTDGNISAEWMTLTKNAKGEIKEKFTIEVSSKTGAGTFKGLSGGEKRKVRLACCLALQDLVASRASKPIELFIADEIDDALDEEGLERLMGILDEKAKEKGTVLVISHNSLSDWIRQSVTVTKRSGVSNIDAVA